MTIQYNTPAIENLNNKFGEIYPNNDKPIYGHRVSDILSFLPDQTREQYNTQQRSNVMVNDGNNNKIEPKNFKTAREYELALSSVYEKEISAKLAIQNGNNDIVAQTEALQQINESLRLSENYTNNVSSTTLNGANKALFLNGAQNNFQYMLKLRASIDKLLSIYGKRLSFGKNFVNSSGQSASFPDYNDPRIERSIEACAIILYQLVIIGAIKANDELDIQGFNINTGQIELDPAIIEYNKQAKKLKLPLKGVFLINDRITNIDNRYATFTGVDLKATYALGYKVGNLKGLSQMSWSIHRGKPDAPVGDEIPAVNRARGRRCLHSSENVYIKDKGLIPINTVEQGDLVQSTPTEFNKVLGVYKEGKKRCNKIKLENGYELIASYDHPIYTDNSWVNTEDLKIGDLVYVSTNVPIEEEPLNINTDILKLIGYLISNGTMITYKSKYGFIDYTIELNIDNHNILMDLEVKNILGKYNILYKDTLNKLERNIKREINIFTGKNTEKYKIYNELHAALLNYDLYDLKPYEKFIPNKFIAKLNFKELKIFLNCLFLNNYSDIINKVTNNFVFKSTSELLIDQIRLLLNKFNIATNKIKLKKGNTTLVYKYNDYELVIDDSINFTKLCDIFENDEIEINENVDFVKYKVISNKIIGDLDVWDLEVEERHSFLCEHILVHNTIAGTMIFNVFDEHPITAIYPYSFFPQDGENAKNPQAAIRESFIKPDQIPAFDITLILTNEYGYASIMTLFGVEIMDDGGGIGMNDLVNEEIIQYTAKDIDMLHSVKVDKNGMIDPYDLTGFNESEIWNRRTQIYQQSEGKTFQERYDEYVNR